MKIAVIILAGGKGSRVSSLADVSKPMLFFNGRPIISYTLELASSLPYPVFVVTSIHTVDCHHYLTSRWRKVNLIFEREPKGVVSIINQLPNLIGAEHFLILPCDHYIAYSLSEFIDSHFTRRADISVAVSSIQSQATTIWSAKCSGELVAQNCGSDDVVSVYGVGTYIMSRKALTCVDKGPISFDSVSVLIKRMMRQKISAYAFLTSMLWFDLGQSPDSFCLYENVLRRLLIKKTPFVGP